MTMDSNKRTVPQSVFETKEALQASRLGHLQACNDLKKTSVHMLDIGNPNHPLNDGIFGYETQDFLKKQFNP